MKYKISLFILCTLIMLNTTFVANNTTNPNNKVPLSADSYVSRTAQYITDASSLGVGDGSINDPYRFSSSLLPIYNSIDYNSELGLDYAIFLDGCADTTYKQLTFKIFYDSYHDDNDYTSFLVLRNCHNVNITFEFTGDQTHIDNLLSFTDPDSILKNDSYVSIIDCSNININYINLNHYVKIENAIIINQSNYVFLNNMQISSCENAITILNSNHIEIDNSIFTIFKGISYTKTLYGFNLTSVAYSHINNITYTLDYPEVNTQPEYYFLYMIDSAYTSFNNSYCLNAQKIDIYTSNDIILAHNNLESDKISISLSFCNALQILYNNLSSNIASNILYLYESDYAIIKGNNLKTGDALIFMSYSNYAIITNNLFESGYYGLYLHYSSGGEAMYNTFGYKIDSIKGNSINVYFYASEDWTFTKNTFYRPLNSYISFMGVPYMANSFSYNYFYDASTNTHNGYNSYISFLIRDYTPDEYDNTPLIHPADEFYFVNLRENITMLYNFQYSTSVSFLLNTGYRSGILQFLVNEEVVYTSKAERFTPVYYTYNYIAIQDINVYNYTYRFIDTDIQERTQLINVYNDAPNIIITTYNDNLTIGIDIEDYSHESCDVVIRINGEQIDNRELTIDDTSFSIYYEGSYNTLYELEITIIEVLNSTTSYTYNNNTEIVFEYPQYVKIVIIIVSSLVGILLISVIIYKVRNAKCDPLVVKKNFWCNFKKNKAK